MTAPDRTPTSAYFGRDDAGRFRPSSAVQGAWNTNEQHVAPALGLLAHLLETDHRSRHAEPLALARVSFDILGTLDIDTVDASTRVIRPGRTIELTEATLGQNSRAAVIARAWFLGASDTTAITGSALPPMPPREDLQAWEASAVWPGEFVTTVDVRRREAQAGRAWFWMRPRLPLLPDEPVSATARLLGLVDIANGISPRVDPSLLAFPNVDLTAHLFRAPDTEWVGFDTTVAYGPHGIGLTQTVLHDEHGPIGTVQQTLTLRA
ncbi:thioesterase family protein [Microbacterium saperdae]